MKAHIWMVGLFVIAALVTGCSTQVADDDDADGVTVVGARDEPDTVNVYEDTNPDTVVVNPNPVVVDDGPDSIFVDDGEPDTVTNNNYYGNGNTADEDTTTGTQ